MPPTIRRDSGQEFPFQPVYPTPDSIDLSLFLFCHLLSPAHSVTPFLETIPSFDKSLAALPPDLLQSYDTLWKQGA